jgi:uncharacterized protein (DUF2141 family)
MIRPVLAIWLAVPLSLAQAPARDLPVNRTVPGTASIAGIVLADDTDARPLRRVRVFLNSSDDEVARTTISDDAGRFVFDGLRAGRYTLGATKEGYVTVNYGARRTEGAGAAVALAEGQAFADMTLRLPRGAVITGVLLDPDGQPIPGVSMRALRYVYTASGERRLRPVTTTMASHITDDRGIYRIFGLAAGEYAIAAPAALALSTDGEILLMNDAEVRRAMDEVRRYQRQQAAVNGETASSSGIDADAPRAIGYAPVFYPGTTAPSQAAMIPVGRGEERTGVDFQLQYVPTSTIRGSVIAPPEVPPDAINIHLIGTSDVIVSGGNNESRATSVTAKGEFSFANVAPGSYTIVAKGTRGIPVPGPIFWATTDVVVEGQDEPGLTLSLQPGLTVSGRAVFEGSTPHPDPARLHVTLVPVLSTSQVSLAGTPSRVDPAGRFTITGITAGKYRLQASIAGSPAWMLATSSVNGRDALDVPVDLRQNVDGAVVTFTNRPGEVSGIVRDSSGKSIAGLPVVLFSVDRTLWTPQSRRIRAVTSSVDGAFRVRMVPPGEYGLAAPADAEDGEWYDPMFLERLLVTSAVRTTIAEGEKKSVDLVATVAR